MSGTTKLSKEELQEKADKIGFFKKSTVKEMYARTNGSFYYSKPPTIVDGHDTYVLKSEADKGATTMKAVDLISKIESSETSEELEAFIVSDEFPEDESRSTVLQAIESKRTELEA